MADNLGFLPLSRIEPGEGIIMGLSRCFFVWFLEIVGGYCYGLKDSVECGGFLLPFFQN